MNKTDRAKYINQLCDMTDEQLIQWIDALEYECDGFEDGCERLAMARSAYANRMTYAQE